MKRNKIVDVIEYFMDIIVDLRREINLISDEHEEMRLEIMRLKKMVPKKALNE